MTDDLGVSGAASAVLAERYLCRDIRGRVTETPGQLMDRVATAVGAAEDQYEPGSSARWAEEFSRLLRSFAFLPNSPTLMNAGTSVGLLSACFVLPVEDSLPSIFGTLGHTAQIHQAGGGTGFSFSHLRPAGDRVFTTHGVASGPVSFLRVYDVATEVIRLSGRRRGANMAVLHVTHPDVEGFVTAKSEPGRLESFNLSVAVTDGFMRSARAGRSLRLVNPRTGKAARSVVASDLLDLIAAEAWRGGDPGLLFIDRVNRANPVPALGRIEATNPCGEVPLLPDESCTLGSVNVARHIGSDGIQWGRLDATVRIAVRFLDDVLDVNVYPAPELEAAARRTRKIGIGVMGLAEMLAELGIPYDSEDGIRAARRVAARIARVSARTSIELARTRGAFPCFDASRYAQRGEPPRRNAQLTSIAPTGTISLLAGTTSGIEPMFAIAYTRNVLGRSVLETNGAFERVARRRGIWSEALARAIAEQGTLSGIRGVPSDLKRIFATALDIAPEWHVRMQAALQRHVDAAVSKTVNLPSNATPEQVREIFLAAWQAGAKGITVYRDGSRPHQVLSAGATLHADTEYTGGCASTVCTF